MPVILAMYAMTNSPFPAVECEIRPPAFQWIPLPDVPLVRIRKKKTHPTPLALRATLPLQGRVKKDVRLVLPPHFVSDLDD
jgi:hypothetical protein